MKRKKYTKEFKEEAVKLVTEQGYQIAEAARNLGINAGTLGRWKREIEDDVGGVSSQKTMQSEVSRLHKENKRLKQEREILKKAGRLLRQRVGLRYQFIDSVKKAYPIVLLCKVMEVSRSGYYAWRKPGKPRHQQDNERLIPVVRELHRASKGTYGTRRLSVDLTVNGFPCGRFRARTLMALAGVKARQRKKFKATTDSNHNLPVAPNLLDRRFNVTKPDRAWVSDVTYVWTTKGWLYLAVIIDLFSRRVVGWSMKNRITRKLVIDALQMAVWRRRPGNGLIFHSDRGSQYCSNDFQRRLNAQGMISSMSRKGDCWDNAVAESFFGSLKSERVLVTSYGTKEEAVKDIVDYIEMFYNSNRLHSYLG
ncbi:MAG: IS3 family transposase, partial [Desulfatiglandales bacterium]